MATITLESLELDEARLQAARDEIQQNAYYKWEKAGCPQEHDSLKFWREAEYEWIEFHYVPSRPFEEKADVEKPKARSLVSC